MAARTVSRKRAPSARLRAFVSEFATTIKSNSGNASNIAIERALRLGQGTFAKYLGPAKGNPRLAHNVPSYPQMSRLIKRAQSIRKYTGKKWLPPLYGLRALKAYQEGLSRVRLQRAQARQARISQKLAAAVLAELHRLERSLHQFRERLEKIDPPETHDMLTAIRGTPLAKQTRNAINKVRSQAGRLATELRTIRP